MLDSTLLGTFLGLALKVRQTGPGWCTSSKLNEMMRSLFRGTGLDQIFEMTEPR